MVVTVSASTGISGVRDRCRTAGRRTSSYRPATQARQAVARTRAHPQVRIKQDSRLTATYSQPNPAQPTTASRFCPRLRSTSAIPPGRACTLIMDESSTNHADSPRRGSHGRAETMRASPAHFWHLRSVTSGRAWERVNLRPAIAHLWSVSGARQAPSWTWRRALLRGSASVRIYRLDRGNCMVDDQLPLLANARNLASARVHRRREPCTRSPRILASSVLRIVSKTRRNDARS